LEKTVQGIIGSAFGSSGERCMATSVVAVVDDIADEFIETFVAETKKLDVGDGRYETNFVGPLIRDSHKQRVVSYIEKGVEEGAELLVDGREKGETASKEEGGYYVGATVFDHV